MHGRATAPGAGTVLNALATGTGSAFALDIETTAEVDLDPEVDTVTGHIEGQPDADTVLIERCVDLVVDRFGDGQGGTVRTESEVPTAAGLKSSSAAANAAVLATCSALDVEVVDDLNLAWAEPERTLSTLDACRLGVRAAREAGVTVTGAFDDASASMFGGVTVTDNDADELLAREAFDHEALVWVPDEQAYSADADAERCARVAPVAEVVADLAKSGRYETAMTVNGLAFSAALGFDAEPAVEALPDAAGVSLSGTGPSVVAVGQHAALDRVQERWEERPGETIRTETREAGAAILE